MLGCETQILMHKAIAIIEIAVKNKVYMSIHQAKSQDDDIVFLYCHKNPVHAIYEIGIIIKQPVNKASVCIEMPTIIYRMVLPFDKRFV